MESANGPVEIFGSCYGFSDVPKEGEESEDVVVGAFADSDIMLTFTGEGSFWKPIGRP